VPALTCIAVSPSVDSSLGSSASFVLLARITPALREDAIPSVVQLRRRLPFLLLERSLLLVSRHSLPAPRVAALATRGANASRRKRLPRPTVVSRTDAGVMRALGLSAIPSIEIPFLRTEWSASVPENGMERFAIVTALNALADESQSLHVSKSLTTFWSFC
jgi:hypothetical protein